MKFKWRVEESAPSCLADGVSEDETAAINAVTHYALQCGQDRDVNFYIHKDGKLFIKGSVIGLKFHAEEA